jgi:hypothetical protein
MKLPKRHEGMIIHKELIFNDISLVQLCTFAPLWQNIMYNLEFDGNGNASTGTLFPANQWTDIKFEWDDLQKGSCRLIIDGNSKTATLPLKCQSINGINYVHFQSADKEEDKYGFLIGSVKAVVE